LVQGLLDLSFDDGIHLPSQGVDLVVLRRVQGKKLFIVLMKVWEALPLELRARVIILNMILP
jgi:hypothetical protein